MANRSSVHGVAIVDKPPGPTSHDVVARVRRALHTRHVGHAGTLDPMASGVLVIAVGEATKLVPYLTADDKSYVATIRLGIGTDTLDAEGTETERVPVPDILRDALERVAVGHMKVTNGHIDSRGRDLLEAALEAERARKLQLPPAFSAIRIAGERAHEIARRGEAPALSARPVAVRDLQVAGAVIEGERIELTVTVDVTKGYFVRALARDLAVALGTVGHLTALRRARSGAFPLADAVPLDALTSDSLMTVVDAASRALPVTVLDEVGVRAVSFGQRVPAAAMRDPHSSPSAWLDARGALLAIGKVVEDGTGRVLRGFPCA